MVVIHWRPKCSRVLHKESSVRSQDSESQDSEVQRTIAENGSFQLQF